MTLAVTSPLPESARRDAGPWWRAVMRAVALVLVLLLALPAPEPSAREAPSHAAIHPALVVEGASPDAPNPGLLAHCVHCACHLQAVAPGMCPLAGRPQAGSIAYARTDDRAYARTTAPPHKPPRA
ncbi:hypothetical protein [Methylobacterium nodulans]|uniref:DUF2946 domain-containing protein n=1 Tax=Methylobacterium nodulans (strain LMG 21967 / CNCM I-2342 / ORS 2060) TaxID=460265 RepID=B8IUQ5_METNO|nr:hypothetical protein [Methylobacterium nodulans]ACL57123.1 conserved hypothetical protein [Methylobacterium nodulans ORS 2060]